MTLYNTETSAFTKEGEVEVEQAAVSDVVATTVRTVKESVGNMGGSSSDGLNVSMWYNPPVKEIFGYLLGPGS